MQTQTYTLGHLFDDPASVPAPTPDTTLPAATPAPTLVESPLAAWEAIPKPIRIFWWIARPVSAAASAYHGYKRNQSVGWAIWWGLMGSMFPLITPAIGIAQGFDKKSPNLKGRTRRRRIRR